MKKYWKPFILGSLISFFLFACSEEKTVKEKLARPQNELQAALDRAIIREYIGLQTNMIFDSTQSGIFYSLENKGFGDPPSDSSTVTAHYALYLVDGTLIQSSYVKGEPLTFKLSDVITGWQEAIQLLGVTGKGTFVIPSGLAYAATPPTRKIPRNAILVFDIELLEAIDD